MDQNEMHESAMRVLREQADQWLIEDVEKAFREERVIWEARDGGSTYALQIQIRPGVFRSETPLLVFLDDRDFETGDSIYDL